MNTVTPMELWKMIPTSSSIATSPMRYGSPSHLLSELAIFLSKQMASN